MTAKDPRIGLNRANWNERTRVHAVSDFYDVAGFKAGRITLNRFERAGVGDVRGKSLLHLQCHFGLDTLSWARLGAKATGIDISDDAIRHARNLSDEVGLDARFVRSDVYDLPGVLDGEFDIGDGLVPSRQPMGCVWTRATARVPYVRSGAE